MNTRRRQVPKGVSLGEAVRSLREDQRLTLRALAEKVGISAPFLSDLEHGRRQTDRYAELAEALGVAEASLRELDTRVTPDLKEWLTSNPRLVSLLKDLQASGRPVPLEALREALKRTR